MLRIFIIGLASSVVSALFESCNLSVERLKEGPATWTDVISANRPYEDESFNGFPSLYRFGFEDYGKWRDYELNHWFGSFYFQRVTEVYPDSTMFGSNNPQWHDIMQGMAGTCYIEAALAAVAEFPSVI